MGSGSAQRLGSRRIGLGRFRYETTDHPRTFICRASGFDGPMLLKDSLAFAESFGERNPDGWVWITDLRRLLWTSPRSFFYARRIRKLPGCRGYAVIARFPFRIAGRLGGFLIGAQKFVKNDEQALAFASSKLRP